jgi:hypothetical protein
LRQAAVIAADYPDVGAGGRSGRREQKMMRDVRPLFAWVATIAAVLVVAGTLLVSRGPIDALLLIVVVTGLAGLYTLRRYARARLLYHRAGEGHQSDLDSDSTASSNH